MTTSRTILADEALFGDGAPQWKNALTSTWAEASSAKLVARLRRFSDDFAGAAVLADKVEACRPGRRCASGADPKCARAMQRWLTANVCRLARPAGVPPNQTGPNWYACAVVSPDAQAPIGELASIDCKQLSRAVRQGLEESGVANWAIFGGDISCDDQTKKGLGRFWQYHGHGFVVTADPGAVAESLRTKIPRVVTVPCRVEQAAYDGTAYGASYALKPQFYRRTSYWDGAASCWRTNSQRLEPRQLVELALMLHELGFSGRLFGFRLRLTSKGNTVLLGKRA
jgi:hypothetical protein